MSRTVSTGPKTVQRVRGSAAKAAVPKSISNEMLLQQIGSLRDDVISGAQPILERLGGDVSGGNPAVTNLAHYLALRHHDIREIQRQLMWRGLSSLGRLEGRVVPVLDAVTATLSALVGRASPRPSPTQEEFFAGEARLTAASDELFGPPPGSRRSRIMVTLPPEAAGDPALVVGYAKRGMDVARINCAHDGPMAWRGMAQHVQTARKSVGRPIKILMDIAGPKIRTGTVLTPHKSARVQPGDAIRLVASGSPRTTKDVPFSATISVPGIVGRLSPGNRFRYDDGKLDGVVEAVADGEVIIRVERTKNGGAKLKPEKGINLPDTSLGLSPLTAKDEEDLETLTEYADILGYSFVSQAEDIDLLEAALGRRGRRNRPLGLIAKIELPDAVKNLPDLIARASGRMPFGVMIARGDLAAEIGFERVAEMQEEILWICEAASVPAIWATQVLEALVQSGIPSRGEMTDAAMGARAECVMLNKGPEVELAIETLDRLLARMDANLLKKTPRLRALRSW